MAVPRDYRVSIDLEALAFLPRSGKQREAVLVFLRNLATEAHLGGDFRVVDPETDRHFEVSIVAGLAITWWIDPPVYTVLVVDIRTAS